MLSRTAKHIIGSHVCLARLFSQNTGLKQPFPPIWVHLISTGAAELGFGSVNVADNHDTVDALRKAVIAKFRNTLKNCDGTDLTVKPSQGAPLGAKEKLTVLKPDEAGELSVYVEVPTTHLRDLLPEYKQRAKQFAEMCRTPSKIMAVSMTEEKLPFGLDNGSLTDRVLSDRIYDLDIYEDESKEGSPCLRASIIPGEWPLFWAEKQSGLKTSRILYQRQSPTDRERIAHTIKMLKAWAENHELGAICWLGTPGIAKSAALNEVLRHFIEHLGEPSFPPVVGLRINGVVVIWEWDASAKAIRISEKMGETGPHSSLQAVSEIIHAKHGILIVEPDEWEPGFGFLCPTLIALTRKALDALKFNSKCGGVDYLVVGTWRLDECKAAAWIEAMTKPDDDWSAAMVSSTVETRFMKVGGRPRFILNEAKYNHQVSMLHYLATTGSVNWSDTSIYNLESNAQCFIAPEPDITSKIARWKFLCKESEDAFDKMAKKDLVGAQKAITNFSLKWPYAEELIHLIAEGDPDIPGHTPIWITAEEFHINPDCRHRGDGPPTTYSKRGQRQLCEYCRRWFVVRFV